MNFLLIRILLRTFLICRKTTNSLAYSERSHDLAQMYDVSTHAYFPSVCPLILNPQLTKSFYTTKPCWCHSGIQDNSSLFFISWKIQFSPQIFWWKLFICSLSILTLSPPSSHAFSYIPSIMCTYQYRSYQPVQQSFTGFSIMKSFQLKFYTQYCTPQERNFR